MNCITPLKLFIFNNLAERVGFEPTLPFRVNTLSKRAPSATRPSLRRGSCYGKQTFRSDADRTEFPAMSANFYFDSMVRDAESQTSLSSGSRSEVPEFRHQKGLSRDVEGCGGISRDVEGCRGKN
jgi:hypothetical protein